MIKKEIIKLLKDKNMYLYYIFNSKWCSNFFLLYSTAYRQNLLSIQYIEQKYLIMN